MLRYTLRHSSSSIFNTDAVLPNPRKRFQCFLVLLRKNPKCHASLSSPCGLCCTDRKSFLSAVCPGTLAAARPAAYWGFAAENSQYSETLLSSPTPCSLSPLGALPYLSSPLPFSTTLIVPCKGKGLMVPNTSQQHTADLSEHVPGMGKSNNVHKTVYSG